MLDKLEKKFGKYAITNFSYYMMVIYIIGAILGMINPMIYYSYLALDFDAILSGQIWRFITFIFYPTITSISFLDLLFGACCIWMYYYIGRLLESTWGAFRFNVYYLSGLILNILATLLIYLIFGESISFGMTYIQNALFLAFATIMPDQTIRLYFIIPIKVKWLGFIYGGILGYQIITNFITFTPSGIALAVAMTISILNFLVYFVFLKKGNIPSKRTRDFNKKIKKSEKDLKMKKDFPAHACCVCGRTSLSNPELQFRYCSKCEGLHEFCNDHIFTHEHIKEENNKK